MKMGKTYEEVEISMTFIIAGELFLIVPSHFIVEV